MHRPFSTSGALLLTLFTAAAASAQQPATQKPYDGIQAGLDAYRLAEEKRQGAVSQQLYLNDQTRFWNGYPTSRGESIYYGYLSPAAMAAYGYAGPNAGYGSPLPLTRANLDYAYGAGPQGGGFRQNGAGPLAVFQPWPYVPGNVWGYPAYYQPARQPIGTQQIQTSPTHWESHPIYDPPLTLNASSALTTPPTAASAITPPTPTPVPPAPSSAALPTAEVVPPGPAAIFPSAPAAPASRGPREY